VTDHTWFQKETGVSRETVERLRAYADLLIRWNPRINLVSKATIPDLWNRHILDSAQLADLAPNGPLTWADIGSGAGFPGLVVAILRPDTKAILVESDQRKAAFLNTVIRATDAPVQVVAKRVEAVAPLAADVCSARAFTALKGLLETAETHLKPTGTGLFPKGAKYRDELKDALEHWSYHCETIQSKTDPAAVILKLTEIQRVERTHP